MYIFVSLRIHFSKGIVVVRYYYYYYYYYIFIYHRVYPGHEPGSNLVLKVHHVIASCKIHYKLN
jgi:hypothetical protein